MKFREVKIKEVREVKPIKKTSLTSEAAAIYAALFADDFVMPVEEAPVKEERIAMIADDFDPSKKINSEIILSK